MCVCVRVRSSACMYEYPRVGVLTGCKVWMCSCMFMCAYVAGRECMCGSIKLRHPIMDMRVIKQMYSPSHLSLISCH